MSRCLNAFYDQCFYLILLFGERISVERIFFEAVSFFAVQYQLQKQLNQGLRRKVRVVSKQYFDCAFVFCDILFCSVLSCSVFSVVDWL